MSCTNRRFTLLAVFFLLVVCLAGTVVGAADRPIVLENDRVWLGIDPEFGTIVRVLDKSSRIELVPEVSLAGNFRLVLLMPDGKTDTIVGRDQKLTGVERSPDVLVLRWNGPLVDTAGTEHKVSVRMDAKAVGDALEFRLHADNHSRGKIRTASYPMIGGLSKFGAPGKPADGVIWVPTSRPWTRKIELPFPQAAFGYPGHANMSFTCIQSTAANKALYLASHEKTARYKVYLFQEHANDKAKDVFVCVQHHPFTPSGKALNGSTVVLKVVDGDWRAAGRVYREFFIRTFGLPDPKKDWIRKQSFFLMTMFMLPEGTINYTFKDIPRWAKAAKEHGVNAVQISGWQMGGHDNGYPHYVPDPRLGTWKELEEGIRACHEMGLKVFFFVNYQPVMTSSDWYKKELHKYREYSPTGGLTWNAGWGMGTLQARMERPKLMTWVDLGFPEYRKIIVDQFEALAKIGADGIHVDKVYPARISYNPNSPMSPDTSTWEGTILLSQEIRDACRKHNPDWAMSFECSWDRALQFGGSTWWVGNQRVTRSIFPENAETLSITSAYDYLGINNAVRGGHQVMLAPRAFSRGMDWKPFAGLNDYIRDVKRVQDQLQDTVFLGEVLHHDGVHLADRPAHGVEYNVFRHRQTGLRACVLTNATMTPKSMQISGFDKARSSRARIHLPSQESRVVNLPASIMIPAERIVFLEELVKNTETAEPRAESNRQDSPTPNPETRGAPGNMPKLPPFDAAKSVRLENDDILIEVSRANGSVTRIHDKKAGLELIIEPRLAGSWKFAFPLPGKEPWQTIEANWIVGRQQKLSSIDVADNKIKLKWKGPLMNYLGEPYNASVTETIELNHGARFSLTIENHTPYQVGEAYFPVFGGIQGLGNSRRELRQTEFVRPAGKQQVMRTNIFFSFANMPMFGHTTFGDTGPEQFFAYPKPLPEPWVGFQSKETNRSASIGWQDPSNRRRIVRLELIPSRSDTPREDGNWPRPDELKGDPVGVELSVVDFMGAAPGANYSAAPVFIQFHDGDWRKAKKIYMK
ncbi:MAG: hypothetical protein JW818_07725 [Pirellulales bacterium]|nr:hypothetical protein [Pirellulales bacterium]